MLAKLAQTATPIDSLLERRWSPRSLNPKQDISLNQLNSLLEAARWAPSCYGEQPWHYVVCHKSTNPKAWEKAFNCLVAFNQNWVKNAPLILLATCAKRFKLNNEPNHWAQYDTGAASENICLQATSMGMVAHQMAGFDARAAAETFQVPDTHHCIAMIAVGYQAEPEKLPDDLQAGELAERKRNPLAENFYDGIWGKGVSL